MDGNGRWAQRRHLPRIAGHRYGTKTARTTIETCARLNIEALTLYAFSVENWRRPKVETDFLMQLLREYIRKEMRSSSGITYACASSAVSMNFPRAYKKMYTKPLSRPPQTLACGLCIAFNYGGRAEIVDAMNAILAQRSGNGTNGHESNGHGTPKRNGHFERINRR